MLRLFARIMLCTEVLNCRAISRQVSLSFTVYSIGGRGVQVGRGVIVAVLLGVVVNVGVTVAVVSAPTNPSSGAFPAITIKYTNNAIRTSMTTMIAIKAIRFILISGMRFESILSLVFLIFGEEGSLVVESSVPQTRHLRAFSESFVPHTGQLRLLLAGVLV